MSDAGSVSAAGSTCLRYVAGAGGGAARNQIESREVTGGQDRVCVVASALVVERSFAWAARFRRLARDYERLPETLAGLHFLAFAMLLLKRFVTLTASSA